LAEWLVVGLGNPGPTYARNRHNVGAMVVQELARRGSATWKSHRMLKADVAQLRVSSAGIGVASVQAESVVLATTRVFMNQSGVAVRNLLADHKLRASNLIVVHDELDLDLDRLRVKFGGGDNGHNGLKSIRAMVGTGDYYRVRVGIGRPSGGEVTDWVLNNFSFSEQHNLAEVVLQAGEAVASLILAGLASTQAAYNS
jgi:PTH1 family peptidyl-tRNA hydrolase